MNRLAALAMNTFRETLREKLLAVILVFACLLILSAFSVGQLSMHEEFRVIRDLGLGGISVFGKILAIVAGVNLVYKEIERKTLYAFIPKPIHRWQFVVGKYLGLALTLTIQVGVMSAVLCATLYFQGLVSSQDAPLSGALGRAIGLIYVETLLVTAIAVLFSTFSTPFLSGLFTSGIFLIGRSIPDLHAVIGSRFKDTPGMAALFDRALAIFPDLHLFYVSGSIVEGRFVSVNSGDFIDWAYLGSSVGYASAYGACVMALAILIFSRRDFV